MRTLINCLVIFFVLLCQKTEAASAPLSHSFVLPTHDTDLNNSHVLTQSFYFPNKKAGFIKKLHYRILQKTLKHLSNRSDEGTRSKLNVLSIISLALGIIGVIVFFSFYSPIAFIASLAALIIGLLALGKRKNNSKGSRAMAIIGVILGGGFILFVLLALIAFSSGQ